MERMFHVKHQAYALRNERFARSPVRPSIRRMKRLCGMKNSCPEKAEAEADADAEADVEGEGALRIGFAGGLFQRLFPVNFSSAGLGSPVTVGFGWGKSGNRGAALKFCGYPRTMGAIEQVVYYWPKCSKACNSPVRPAGIG